MATVWSFDQLVATRVTETTAHWIRSVAAVVVPFHWVCTVIAEEGTLYCVSSTVSTDHQLRLDLHRYRGYSTTDSLGRLNE